MNVRMISIVAASALVLAAGASAQERLTSGSPEPNYAPGWTFTPTFGFAETYDDNISLFGLGTAEEQNNDYIATYFPAADLHYSGRHTRFGMDYTGSFLNYRTFSALNRWDQRGKLDFRRTETAHLKWFMHGAAAMMPSTEEIELGGIPYRHTGARTMDGRGGVEYSLNARDSFSSSFDYQVVDFDRPTEVNAILRGGNVLESLTAWRHKANERLAWGADYSFRRAAVVGDVEQFNIHTTEAAIDYDLNSIWSLSAGAGVVYLQGTDTTEARTGPAWRIAVERHRDRRSFHAGYLRSYIPAFGFGGTIDNQELGVGFRMPLFGSRTWYTDNSAVYRDDTPLINSTLQLPLRSLRTYSVVGWEPQNWVRLEAFYARVQQTSLRAGGQLFRNRIGFQIVTSMPVRMQ